MSCYGCYAPWPASNHLRIVVWLPRLKREVEYCSTCYLDRDPDIEVARLTFGSPKARTKRINKQRVTSH